MHIPIVVIIIISMSLVFEFINGFHDTANAVATSISTKSLEPYQAISIAAVFNLIGGLCGTAIAVTIVKGFADPVLATHSVIFSALCAAIVWNLTTWYFGIPSSSAHALIGSLVGAIMFNNSWHVINFATVINKVVLPMFISPVLGFFMAMLIVFCIHRILRNNTQPRKTNNFIREIQVLSTAFLSFSHGTNDAQKTMGIITLTLFSANLITTYLVPHWVILACSIAMSLGTLSGGAKIIKTLSTCVAQLKPASGFAAEVSSATLLFIGSRFGVPLSTTHAVAGSIMGAGSTSHFGLNWSIVKNMVISWLLTFPVCVILAGLFLQLTKLFLQ